MLVCAREGCDETFIKKTHNQKYHDDECCRLATNQRIMQKYYARRDRRLGKVRICQDCNVTKLSRYNAGTTCSSCDLKREVEVNDSVIGMLSSVTWVA